MDAPWVCHRETKKTVLRGAEGLVRPLRNWHLHRGCRENRWDAVDWARSHRKAESSGEGPAL
jgi:hypothetical protein